ncbi:protein adenylyltransferase SelO-like [Neocloeon triangulifer]|uniref:protein adenylyltransferase SelO-like n=1 Tax=Neocloeon triangulifer TaxID=2078957 RepID=UPI00286F32FE|nr:protein adenylyltransferase SelO-like [Neocloeon triangulifer]
MLQMIRRLFSILPLVLSSNAISSHTKYLPGFTQSQVYNRYLRNYTFVMTSVTETSSCQLARTIGEWSFAPNTLLSLPLDEVEENYVRRDVRQAVFSKVTPTPLQKNLQLVAVSDNALVSILDMDPVIANTEEFVQFVAGDKILPSCTPLAHRYGGHQFGVWASQLGDGRANLLGEYVNRAGERWELQLKGSGLTPYSRGADGRAVLRSSVREFLAAEAMYYLGVPTSRVAALITSDVGVIRDPLYNGNPVVEKASVVLRLAPSWFRIGSLELPVKRGETATLRALLTYLISTSFPELWQKTEKNLAEACVTFGLEVAKLNYKMWVEWQRVGFVHGVMNSDNISLMGVTIDYGPFGFMPAFNRRYVPNTSDDEARYCYQQQIRALFFDLEKLRESLGYVITSDYNTDPDVKAKLVQEMAEGFRFLRRQSDVDLENMYLKKLGLTKTDHYEVVEKLLILMEDAKADFTATFRQLSEANITEMENIEATKFWALKEIKGHKDFDLFWSMYVAALKEECVEEEERKRVMCSVNPCYVLRNWIAQEAIAEAENGNFQLVRKVEKILQRPYERQEEADRLNFGGKPPTWEKQLKVSCSS